MPKTIGIFCHGQSGDALTVSSVIHYKKELWGEDCKIIWFIDDSNRDLLKYQDIELRTFPRGFGYPEMVKEENAKLVAEGKEPIWRDWSTLVDENNHLIIEGTRYDEMIAGITHGYFPAPHHMSPGKRHGINYPNVSKKVFGVPMDAVWRPVLFWSDQERAAIAAFIEMLPAGKNVLVETYAGSGQTKITHEMIEKSMEICEEKWGDCNFIFLSHKYLNRREEFPAFDGYSCVSASDYTVRQCALLGLYADFLISVSSGVTCALSAHGIESFPILQFCGSAICGTKELANGEMVQVFSDGKELVDAETEYYHELQNILLKYK